ncbi:uncharacterized protein (TIGR02271 family) [Halopolyspora algeriensis]|uniref:Uncharacterized protein (TIGR02271 family) n=1 Tax=Halopolyspora algeriensis TaxID=1500506 RepID=A0A368VUL1_9ACTN|nr:PRC and DUF2382 domain-containing protein [Halopolyspora algeriensis]RCW43656.1 uncharacterized protein (TIGR02271 family) [Halopolyspora algeriensis]TQM47561.1 uncharacterized protein (TIGR02271 family) [Halopolyspora algeriensis]
MKDVRNAQDLIGSDVYSPDGSKVGRIGNVYLDDDTRQPEWVTVKTGMFGTKESFVPLAGATATDSGVNVEVSKDQVSQAPRIEAEQGHLSEQEGRELYEYYHMQPGAAGGQQRGEEMSTRRTETAGQETETRSTEPQSMTRSEEHLRVGKQNVESGRVRLRKYVTTEQESVTVPVSREEVRVEREPINESEQQRMSSDAEIGEQEQEVVLHSEQPVVGKESVPVERVKLDKDEVTEEQTVSDEVQREQFDVDDEGGRHRRDRGS